VDGRTEVSAMVRGMGMGMKVLELLVEEISTQGGSPEILTLMTRKRFAGNVTKIAKAMMGCDWRIPASEMRELAWKAYKRGNDGRVSKAEGDAITNLCWKPVLQEMGIPFQEYCSDPSYGPPAIPPSLLDKMNGLKMSHPLFIGKHVVVDLDKREGMGPLDAVGEVILPWEVGHIALADRRYFDFTK
jgi:hypothetical protein